MNEDMFALGAEREKAPLQFAKAQKSLRPVFLREEQPEGHTAPCKRYVLWCDVCYRFTVTHPAGYGRIHCGSCLQYHRVMTWPRMRDKFLKPLRFWGILLAMVSVVGLLLVNGVALLTSLL